MTAAVDLIRQAQAVGVVLTVRDNRLEYDAPDTPEAERLLAALAADRSSVVELIRIRRGDAVAKRLIANGVDTDLADELSERVAIETEFLHPLLEGARLLDARLIPKDAE